jgi:hypothetical protein
MYRHWLGNVSLERLHVQRIAFWVRHLAADAGSDVRHADCPPAAPLQHTAADLQPAAGPQQGIPGCCCSAKSMGWSLYAGPQALAAAWEQKGVQLAMEKP